MKYIATITLILLFSIIGFGQTKKIRVQVKVMGDAEIQASVTNYLTAELGKISDVDTTGGGIILYVIAVSNQTADGKISGYTFSAIYLQPMLAADKSVIMKFLDTSLNIGGAQDAEQLSKDIVADFAAKVLEPLRAKP